MSSQVKRKAQEADEWIRQQAEAAKNPPVVAEFTPISDEANEPLQESPPAELDTADTFSQVPDTAVLAPDVQSELKELRESLEKADQRWRSLQGQIGSKDRQIEQLHELLGKMQSAPPVQQAPPPTVKGHTEADVDAFGEDMIDVVERVARNIAAQQTAELQAKLDALTQDVSAVSQYTAKAVMKSFDQTLDELSPQWVKLDTDDGFHAWLDSQPRRRQVFTTMSQARDAEGCAEYFNLYSASIGELQAIQDAKKRQKGEQLEMQIAPGKSRTTAPSAKSTPDTGIITKSEISHFYANKKSFTPEEFAKRERMYAKAMKDKRVDYTK